MEEEDTGFHYSSETASTSPKKMPPPEDPSAWRRFKQGLYEWIQNFTGNTSFHGMRYTTEATSWFGRIIWLMIVIAFSCWFTYIVAERVMTYQGHPVSVDMNVAYNASLKFPSVAICNTNQFKMSKAWEAGIYRDLEAFYGADLEDRRNITKLDRLNSTKTMLHMSHKKEDMIKKCTWQGRNCSHQNFTTIMTDFGVCFVFNDHINANKSIRNPEAFSVQNTGATDGLQLYLNAEVYESSPGPHLPSGIQVLIFDGYDQPRVLDLGTAIPVFEISRVALHISTVTRPPYPHGNCESKTLRDYKSYSFQACLAEAHTNRTADECGCIGYGQKWGGPNRPPYCNLSTMYGCYKDTKSKPLDHVCTHPCHQEDYSTTLSNTDLSATSIASLIDVFKSDNILKKKYRKATLLRQLVDKTKVATDLENLGNLHRAHQNLFVKIVEPLDKKMIRVAHLIDKIIPQTNQMASQIKIFTNQLKNNYELVFKVQTIENYLRPALVKDEIRVWDLATFILKDLKSNMFQPAPQSQYTAKRLMNELQHYFDASIMIIYSVEKMFNVYTRGLLKKFRHSFIPSFYIDGKQVPLVIIKKETNRISDQIGIFTSKGQVLNSEMRKFQSLALRLQGVTKSAFKKLYGQLLSSANSMNKRLLPDYISETNKLHDAMKTVSTILDDGIKAYQDSEKELKSFLLKLRQKLIKYKNILKAYDVLALEKYFTDIEKEAHAIVQVWSNGTKDRLINLVSSETTFRQNIEAYTRGTFELIDILLSIRSTKTTEAETITKLITVVQEIKRDSFWVFKSIEGVWDNTEPALKELFQSLVDVYKYIGTMQKATDVYTRWLRLFVNDIVAFNKTLMVDDDMIRKNILGLQVFYQSLSYTDVVKSPAYSWFSLLSDIGGTAGLFLGGSFITILELLYYIGKAFKPPKIAPPSRDKTDSIEDKSMTMDNNDTGAFDYGPEFVKRMDVFSVHA